MASSIVYNMDCLEYMKSLPDKAFSLAVVDPPYGGGCSQNVQVERERERRATRWTRRISRSNRRSLRRSV